MMSYNGELLEKLDTDESGNLELQDIQKKLASGFFNNPQNAEAIAEIVSAMPDQLTMLTTPLSEAIESISNDKRTEFLQQGVYSYSRSEIVLFQLSANIMGDPVAIDGSRGNKWDTEGEINPYIWKSELSRKFPNAPLMLAGMDTLSWKTALINYQKIQNAVRQQGRYFEEQIPDEDFEHLLINCINKAKLGDKPYVYQDFIDYLSTTTLQSTEYNTNNNERQILLSFQNELNSLVQQPIHGTQQVESFQKLLKQARNLGQSHEENVLLALNSLYTQQALEEHFGSEVVEQITSMKNTLAQAIGEYDTLNDTLTQIESSDLLDISDDVTRHEYSALRPDDAKANRKGLRGPLGDYQRGIGQNFDRNNKDREVPGDIKKINVPGASPIIVRIPNNSYQIENIIQKTSDQKLIVLDYEKYQTNDIGNYSSYSYNHQNRSEQDKNIFSLQQLGYATTSPDGTIIITTLDGKEVQRITQESQIESQQVHQRAQTSMNTPEFRDASSTLNHFTCEMSGVNDIYSKMTGAGIDWDKIDYTDMAVSAINPFASMFDDIPIKEGLSEFDVQYIFETAYRLKTSLHELRGKKADLERTKLQLTSMLKNLDQGTMRSDEEQKIHYAITSVDSLLNGMKEGGSFQQFTDMMTNPKFVTENNTFSTYGLQRLKKEGLKWMTGILVAGLVASAAFSAGTSLLAIAAISGASGIIASRAGQALNETIHNYVFTTTITLDGIEIPLQYDDPTDFEQIKQAIDTGDSDKARKLVGSLGVEFMMATGAMYGGMLLVGRIGSKAISSYIAKNPHSNRSKAFLKLKPNFAKVDDPFTSNLFQQVASKGNKSGYFSKFVRETGKELVEESKASAVQYGSTASGIPGVAQLFTRWNYLTPSPRTPRLFNNNKVSVSGPSSDGTSTLSYNGNRAELQSHFTSQGFTLQANGSLTKPNPLNPQGVDTIILQPSEEPLTLRQLDLETNYPNLTWNMKGYDVSQLTPGEAYSLQQQCMQYFVVQKSPNGFQLINGSDTIHFHGKPAGLPLPLQIPANQQREVTQPSLPFSKHINNDANSFILPTTNGVCAYKKLDDNGEHQSVNTDTITMQQAQDCFMHGLDVSAELMEGQNRAILSSGSLFLNVPGYKKLSGDIDIATNIQSFTSLALEPGPNGLTKLEQFAQDGKIHDLLFTTIQGQPLDTETMSQTEISALVNQGNIRVEFNIISPDGLVINSEFFPEPPGRGLIQLGTERTAGEIHSYMIKGREVKTVSETLAAKSYLINIAHEMTNNNLDGIVQGAKFKDSERIHNIFEHLASSDIKTPDDMITFIDATIADYKQQPGIDGEVSGYLATGLTKLESLRTTFKHLAVDFEITQNTSRARGPETTISFNDFTNATHKIKERLVTLHANKEKIPDEIYNEISRIQQQVNINDPQSFPYYYDLYQLRINFLEPLLVYG